MKSKNLIKREKKYEKQHLLGKKIKQDRIHFNSSSGLRRKYTRSSEKELYQCFITKKLEKEESLVDKLKAQYFGIKTECKDLKNKINQNKMRKIPIGINAKTNISKNISRHRIKCM